MSLLSMVTKCSQPKNAVLIGQLPSLAYNVPLSDLDLCANEVSTTYND